MEEKYIPVKCRVLEPLRTRIDSIKEKSRTIKTNTLDETEETIQDRTCALRYTAV